MPRWHECYGSSQLLSYLSPTAFNRTYALYYKYSQEPTVGELIGPSGKPTVITLLNVQNIKLPSKFLSL